MTHELDLTRVIDWIVANWAWLLVVAVVLGFVLINFFRGRGKTGDTTTEEAPAEPESPPVPIEIWLPAYKYPPICPSCKAEVTKVLAYENLKSKEYGFSGGETKLFTCPHCRVVLPVAIDPEASDDEDDDD